MSSLVWKRRLGRLWGHAQRNGRDVALLYHSVAGGPLSISEEKFTQQMNWLKHDAEVVTLDAMLDTPNPGRLRVVLSFDDGYRSLYDNAHPILVSFGFPAIVYLNSALLGEDKHISSNPELGHYPGEQFMIWDDVTRLAGQGWSAGGHGLDHVDLTLMTAEQRHHQLSGCKSEIEARLGTPCKHFAYTWGHYNSQVLSATRSAGFGSAASGLHGPFSRNSNRFAFPRIDVRAEYELDDFIDVVTGRWDYIGIKQQLVCWLP